MKREKILSGLLLAISLVQPGLAFGEAPWLERAGIVPLRDLRLARRAVAGKNLIEGWGAAQVKLEKSMFQAADACAKTPSDLMMEVNVAGLEAIPVGAFGLSIKSMSSIVRSLVDSVGLSAIDLLGVVESTLPALVSRPVAGVTRGAIATAAKVPGMHQDYVSGKEIGLNVAAGALGAASYPVDWLIQKGQYLWSGKEGDPVFVPRGFFFTKKMSDIFADNKMACEDKVAALKREVASVKSELAKLERNYQHEISDRRTKDSGPSVVSSPSVDRVLAQIAK